jgi:lipoprotein-anchoring transpeptidase ErfK/SrfK
MADAPGTADSGGAKAGLMPDYYPVIHSAVTRLPKNTSRARRVLYDRARRALLTQLRSVQPPLPDTRIRAELFALEAAIRRIEHEPVPLAVAAADAILPDRRHPAFQDQAEPAELPPAWEAPAVSRTKIAIAAATAVAVLGLVVIVGFAGRGLHSLWASAQPPQDIDARGFATSAANVKTASVAPTARNADPETATAMPSYVYRRQPVYYRSNHPAGAVVVDKSQRFIYQVKSNVQAMRYGIGVGADCTRVNGVFRVSRKVVRPDTATADASITSRVTAALSDSADGVRAIYFGAETERIHGSGTSRYIGSQAPFGCFGLMNDDVVDLYERVPLESRVVVTN